MRSPVLVFALVGLTTWGSRATAADPEKPNVLIIVSDDQGWADAGFQGSKEAVTPHLDALAKSGVRCTNGYASHCVCSPSRAGLMTGRYQARFGYEYNPERDPSNERLGVPLTEKLFPQYMKDAGYKTGWVGKWHLGASPKHLPWNRGFDDTFGFIGGGHQYREWKPDDREQYLPLVRDGKELPDVPPHLTAALGEEAVAFVRKNRKQPWMLYLAPNAPHAPHQPTAEREAKFKGVANPQRRKYLAQLSLLDDAVGEVVAALKDTDQTRRTLVFFFSDNGGQLLHSGNNDPLRAGKGTIYEGGVRVPFLVSWPGTLAAGMTYDEPVIALDIFATGLAVAGVSPPKDVKLDGVDLLPHLTGKVKTPPHERLFWRNRQESQVAHAVREGNWKAVRIGRKPAELFDLSTDIAESKNLADEKPDVLKRLTAAIDAWDKEMAPSTNTGKPPSPKAAPPPADTDTDTVFLLEADKATGKFVDRAGRVVPVVKDATVVADDRFGECLKLGESGAGVMVPDGGAIRLAGGMTLDAWVYLEQPPPAKGAQLAVKVGSFAWDLGNGKFNTSWLNFPTEPIVTTKPDQYKYYPVGGDTINGLMNVPVGRWVRLRATYDEATGAVTNLIDGLVDRHRYRYRGPERMQLDPACSLTLLSGVPHARLGPVRLQAGRPRVVPPSLEAYAHALPYQGKVLLTLDHLDPDLPLPVDVTLVWEKPNGPAATLRTLRLDRHARRDVELDMPTWRNVTHTLMVRAEAGGKQVFARDLRVSAAEPKGPVTITSDRTLVRNGKPLFPLFVYHGPPEDVSTLADIGFNVLHNDFTLARTAAGDKKRFAALMKETLDKAGKSGMLVLPGANSIFNTLGAIPANREHAATLGWYGADEPWGELTKLVDSYNTLKLHDPDLPVVVVQNNYSRLQETAAGADIIGVDPYPVPNVSLRAVPDATQAAIRAVGGRKPVWTVIPQYGPKIPTQEELRCMAWLAVAAGADGIGFFCWDEQVRDRETGKLRGWYAKDHPVQIEDLRAVIGELRRLDRVLLARPGALLAAAPANPAVHASLRSAGEKRYLVVANDARRAEATVLTIPDAADGDAPCLSAPDAPALPVRKGKARIELPPLGVAVYDLSARR